MSMVVVHVGNVGYANNAMFASHDDVQAMLHRSAWVQSPCPQPMRNYLLGRKQNYRNPPIVPQASEKFPFDPSLTISYQ